MQLYISSAINCIQYPYMDELLELQSCRKVPPVRVPQCQLHIHSLEMAGLGGLFGQLPRPKVHCLYHQCRGSGLTMTISLIDVNE